MVTEVIHEVRSGLAPAAHVALGQSIEFVCPDASGNQMRPRLGVGGPASTVNFTVCGPVYVDGVEKGEWIGIEVQSIKPIGTCGYVWQRPGLGLVRVDCSVVRRVRFAQPTIEWLPIQPRVSLAKRLHLGTLGVLPARARSANDAGRHGGNMDFFEIGPGATLWVRAQTRGGGVFTGDAHFAIGDGEIGGTGVEVGARVAMRLHRRSGVVGSWPRVCRRERVWVVCAGRTVEEAIRAGVCELCEAFRFVYDASRSEALMAISCLLQLHVCQVVNPHATVALSLAQGVDRILMSDRDGEATPPSSVGLK